MTSTVLPPATASVPMVRAMFPVPMMLMLLMMGALFLVLELSLCLVCAGPGPARRLRSAVLGERGHGYSSLGMRPGRCAWPQGQIGVPDHQGEINPDPRIDLVHGYSQHARPHTSSASVTPTSVVPCQALGSCHAAASACTCWPISSRGEAPAGPASPPRASAASRMDRVSTWPSRPATVDSAHGMAPA